MRGVRLKTFNRRKSVMKEKRKDGLVFEAENPKRSIYVPRFVEAEKAEGRERLVSRKGTKKKGALDGDGVFVISEGVESVDIEELAEGADIRKIVVPKSLVSCRGILFGNQEKLEEIEVNEENERFCAVDGNMYSKDKTVLYRYAAGKSAAEFEVPEGVAELGLGAFLLARTERVIIPRSVRLIGFGCFCNSRLKEVVYRGSRSEWEKISVEPMAFDSCAGSCFIDSCGKTEQRVGIVFCE